jgi:hypothetical protein
MFVAGDRVLSSARGVRGAGREFDGCVPTAGRIRRALSPTRRSARRRHGRFARRRSFLRRQTGGGLRLFGDAKVPQCSSESGAHFIQSTGSVRFLFILILFNFKLILIQPPSLIETPCSE